MKIITLNTHIHIPVDS